MQEEKKKRLSYREMTNMAAEIAEKLEKDTDGSQDALIILQSTASILFNRQTRLVLE